MKSALAFGHQQVGARTRTFRAGAEGTQRLTSLFRASLLEKYPDVPPLSFWIEYWAHASRDPELMEFRAERIARFRQNIAQTVTEGIERGEYQAGVDPLLAADLLQAVLDGLQLKIALDAKTISPTRAMRAFQLLMELLRADSDESTPASSRGRSATG
jgi:hypothetical protein